MYQQCTQFGWFQTVELNSSMRSFYIDDDYYTGLCKSLFDLDMNHYPRVFETENNLGGSKIGGSDIYFSNGSDDPWQSVSQK